MTSSRAAVLTSAAITLAFVVITECPIGCDATIMTLRPLAKTICTRSICNFRIEFWLNVGISSFPNGVVMLMKHGITSERFQTRPSKERLTSEQSSGDAICFEDIKSHVFEGNNSGTKALVQASLIKKHIQETLVFTTSTYNPEAKRRRSSLSPRRRRRAIANDSRDCSLGSKATLVLRTNVVGIVVDMNAKSREEVTIVIVNNNFHARSARHSKNV
jgi:hypothetical protein